MQRWDHDCSAARVGVRAGCGARGYRPVQDLGSDVRTGRSLPRRLPESPHYWRQQTAPRRPSLRRRHFRPTGHRGVNRGELWTATKVCTHLPRPVLIIQDDRKFAGTSCGYPTHHATGRRPRLKAGPHRGQRSARHRARQLRDGRQDHHHPSQPTRRQSGWSTPTQMVDVESGPDGLSGSCAG